MLNLFPTIEYDAIGNGKTKTVTDLLRRVKVRSKVKSNVLSYDFYDVIEGDTPESVADMFYGDPKLSWVILMVNDITDRYNQWPMSNFEWVQYLNNKYTNIYAVHHYYITQTSGNTDIRIDIGTSNADHAGATPVTNYDYEEDIQNQLRRIRILDARYLDQFIEDFDTLINED